MNRPKTFRVTYGATRTAVRRVMLPLFIAVGAVFSVSGTAGAALFSMFNSATETDFSALFGGTAENSSTMAVLTAARTIDAEGSHGGGTIDVVDGVALAAEESPFSGETSEVKAPASPDQISWYIVSEGDTLSQVANLFDVSVSTIVWANELGSDRDIHPGQMLLILPISGIQHTVEKGDTLASIAKDFGGNKEEIIAYNDLPADGTLTVGQTITIPGGEMHEEEAAPTTVAKKSSTVVSSGPSISGYYINPLPGAVKTQGIHGYNAVDLSAPIGTPVRAAAAGTVIVSRSGGWNGGYGSYIVIDHPNGTQTLYAHLSKNSVWQGQEVVQGQVIGAEGNSGKSTGPHLHFEVRGAKNPF